MLEAVSDAVIKADQNGEPGVWVAVRLPRWSTPRTFDVDGPALLGDATTPNGIFAPGGVGHSLLALYLVGLMN